MNIFKRKHSNPDNSPERRRGKTPVGFVRKLKVDDQTSPELLAHLMCCGILQIGDLEEIADGYMLSLEGKDGDFSAPIVRYRVRGFQSLLDEEELADFRERMQITDGDIKTLVLVSEDPPEFMDAKSSEQFLDALAQVHDYLDPPLENDPNAQPDDDPALHYPIQPAQTTPATPVERLQTYLKQLSPADRRAFIEQAVIDLLSDMSKLERNSWMSSMDQVRLVLNDRPTPPPEPQPQNQFDRWLQQEGSQPPQPPQPNIPIDHTPDATGIPILDPDIF